ncbi:xanthine dehydrogenase family protein molybdopterin-binding subunit [Nocardiopsis sp. CNT-189]|uniref:xanthine dehydrogenase family protein molybdopterin-binding subunit n=1 Tax=Nocardiopsis oceanisediminis TaxID=2816862 RepID=UPI003B2A15E7
MTQQAVGAPVPRLEAAAKATGTAPYAYEHPVPDPWFAHAVQATIARGAVLAVDTAGAEAVEGVRAVLTPFDAPRLPGAGDRRFAVLQSPEVAFRGQIVAAVVATTPEAAREAASLVRVEYDEHLHDTVLTADRADLYRPDEEEADTEAGDVDAALAAAPVRVEHTYTTPMEHNNPMEPHTTAALWERGPDRLTLHDSTQGPHTVRAVLAPVLGLDPERIRVLAPHVGGGFGSKGEPHPHNVLAALAARALPGRWVKLALTRRQMFALTGYRTPTVQRVRLGAGTDGRLLALSHESVEQTATVKEFPEMSAVCSRKMYAAPHRRTRHRLAALDVPAPFWMRAPGEAPGMFALESAMDELAHACGLDPVELRIRNEPEVAPDSGLPWADRRLVECLREGARRFGWADRDPAPGPHRSGRWLTGTGVASAVYPHLTLPGSVASIRHGGRGRYTVAIGAADIGTGARTALTQIAAEALGRPIGDVDLRIGDTDLPPASVAGGSTGTTSWGAAITAAAEELRRLHGRDPAAGAEARAGTPPNPEAERYAMSSFGAHFAEVRVDADTGEIRVPRLLGVFSIGRVVNPRTVRSQFIGGMTMGLSMALHEQSVLDPRFGHVVNGDLAEYHIAANADVGRIDAAWLEGPDPLAGPTGSRGAGEIGIVGTAAAIANAAFHATGVRVRDLPLTADRFLEAGTGQAPG